jgi:secreted PhoX family phosphatase
MTDHDDRTANPRVAGGVRTLADIVAERLSRRGLLRGALAGGLLSSIAPLAACVSARPSARSASHPFAFQEIARGADETHHVPEGYEAQVVLRWGDPLFSDSPSFEPLAQTAAAQERQFGYNNDYIGFVPLPAEPGQDARGLLCANHEYTIAPLMLPGVAADYPASMTAALCDVEKAAHGGTIVEIALRDGAWSPVVGSRFNRRITATTPIELTGPAAGHDRLKTGADPTGRSVLGTMNNCAGGVTPWGTYLMAEENVNYNFLGELPAGHPEARNHARYGVPGGTYAWGRFEDRFDVGKEPREPNRFGWVVEVDPMDPASTPKKRTALGRFKHEGAESVVAPDGRVVLYMGDDQPFDYVYKFVTAGRHDPARPEASRDLLDDGVLHVARFEADGTVVWMPLVHGQGPLTEANGFSSQGEVLIETRRASDLLEATPMDRPEDIEPDPSTGRVYVMLTNNVARLPEQIDAANPRPANAFGHIIEIIEPDGDFASTTSRWEILVRCGDPADPEAGAMWNPATSADGWFGSPDNCAVDPSGRLWVATDGNEATGAADGIWAVETEGPARGTGRAFFRAPVGAEVCGPKLTPDGRTFFLSVQHPGDTEGATFEVPGTRWPDFDPAGPPRPSVLAIRRIDGGVVGG